MMILIALIAPAIVNAVMFHCLLTVSSAESRAEEKRSGNFRKIR